MLSFVLGGIGNPACVQNTGDRSFPISLCKQIEHLTDYCCRFFVYQQMPFAVRVFAVAVQCKRTDMQTVDTAVGQYAANIIRHIFQIPFVYKTVDLT